MKAHLEWVQTKHGDKGTEQVLSSLDPETRTTVERSLLTSWIPFKDLIAVDRKVEELWGARALEELGYYSADINLKRTYRAYIKQDIHEFFRRASVLHHLFQDFGNVRYEATGPTSATMVHFDYEFISPILCRTAIGFFKGVLNAHGAKNASVVERNCLTRGDSNCTFDLRWS